MIVLEKSTGTSFVYNNTSVDNSRGAGVSEEVCLNAGVDTLKLISVSVSRARREVSATAGQKKKKKSLCLHS